MRLYGRRVHPRRHAAAVTLALELDVDAGAVVEALHLLVPRVVGWDDAGAENHDEEHEDHDGDRDDEHHVPVVLGEGIMVQANIDHAISLFSLIIVMSCLPP